jgi:hypothetical protein
MRQFLLLLVSMTIYTYCTAQPLSLSFHRNTKFLHSLSSIWRSNQSIHLKQYKNDINMGYGGADISRKPTIVPHITTV